MKKDKKEKVIYYDDGSTIVDMNPVMDSRKKNNQKIKETPKQKQPKPLSGFKEKAKTYFETVKIMIIPMFFVLGILFLLYLAFLFLF